MTRKGFTLIELLAVIVILGVLALLISPTVFSSIDKFNENLRQSQILSIETAALDWASDHMINDEVRTITISELQNEGYLRKDLKKLGNDKEGFSGSEIVEIKKAGKKYNATYKG